jgi:hypothetical protein
MSAFGQGSNNEYLVHIIVVKQLLEQKRTTEDMKMAFKVVLAIKKQLEPFCMIPKDGETWS